MGRPNLNLLPSLLSLSSLIFAQETVLYPPEGLTVNDIDSMNVVFETSYSAVNLTVFCLEDTTNDYAFHAYDGNPLPPTGTAYLAPIDESIGLNWATTTAFQCHMLFGDPYTTSNSFNSGHFTMVSTGGSPTTWSLSSTTTSSSSSTSTSTSGTSTTSKSLSTSTTASTTSPTAAGASSTSPPVTSSTSSGLSPGESAGIGVGVALGVLLLSATVFFFFFFYRRSRRKKAGNNTEFDGAAGGYFDKQPGYQPPTGQYDQQAGGYYNNQSPPGPPGYSQQRPSSYHYSPVESGGRQVASELAGAEGRYELGT